MRNCHHLPGPRCNFPLFYSKLGAFLGKRFQLKTLFFKPSCRGLSQNISFFYNMFNILPSVILATYFMSATLFSLHTFFQAPADVRPACLRMADLFYNVYQKDIFTGFVSTLRSRICKFRLEYWCHVT